MDTVASADGTTIAFDRYGDGPPVIMAVAAFNTRSTTDPLARALAPQFSVLNYDRRGRGDSGDTAPYAVDPGIDDLAAPITAAGGSAALVGYSSRATLPLQAAAARAGPPPARGVTRRDPRAVPAQRRPGPRGGPARRAARHPPRADSRHQPASHRTRHGRVSRRLTGNGLC